VQDQHEREQRVRARRVCVHAGLRSSSTRRAFRNCPKQRSDRSDAKVCRALGERTLLLSLADRQFSPLRGEQVEHALAVYLDESGAQPMLAALVLGLQPSHGAKDLGSGQRCQAVLSR